MKNTETRLLLVHVLLCIKLKKDYWFKKSLIEN